MTPFAATAGRVNEVSSSHSVTFVDIYRPMDSAIHGPRGSKDQKTIGTMLPEMTPVAGPNVPQDHLGLRLCCKRRGASSAASTCQTPYTSVSPLCAVSALPLSKN